MGKKIQRRSKSKPGRHRQQQQPQQQLQPQSINKQALLSRQPEQQINFMRDLMNQILFQPEVYIKQLDSIFILAKAQNVKVATTALRVLAQIFVGAAPLQPVDIKQIQERKGVQITKDEFKVIRFQELLVAQYERYLKMLKQINSKLSVSNFQGDEEMFKEFKKCILHCVMKCFQTLWNFNHFKLLSELLVKFLKNKQAQQSVETFLADKNAATSKAKAKIIADIAGLIKQRPENTLPDQLVRIINTTHIDSNYLQKQTEVIKFRKKKLTKRLYKQQAFDKKMQKEKKQAEKGSLQMKTKIKKQKAKQRIKVKEQVQKQFAQGLATVSKKQLVRGNSAILQQIFYIYFKILVERSNSKYLKDVLEGVLTYAHLINIDLTSNLISHLHVANQSYRASWLANRNQQLLEARLRIAFTAESLINGPLSAYNMDDLKVTTALFKIMRDINGSGVAINKQQFRILAVCLQETLIKRRQLSQEVVATLLREIVSLLNKEQIPKLYILQLIRQIASKYSKITRMFQPDNEGYGLYGFNPHALDPQATNAINTEIISTLTALSKKAQKSKKLPKNITEIVDMFGRQTFIRIEGSPNMYDLLQSDLNLLG